jgi:hypothetical protein
MGELNVVVGTVDDVGDGDALPTRDGALFAAPPALHALIRIDDPTTRPSPGRFTTR